MRAALIGLLALAALAPAAAPQAPDEEWTPLPVPPVALDRLDEGVQEHIIQARAEFDAIMSQENAAIPLRAQAWGALGRIYFAYDLMEAAEPCLLNARALEPGDYRWSYYLGAIYTSYSALDRAIEELLRVAELEPTYSATFVRLGRLYLDRGELGLAKEAFERAMELEPEGPAAYAGLGEVAFGNGEYELATERFHKALEIEPGATALHHRLGMTYRKLGDREKAREHLELNTHVTVGYRDPLVHGLIPIIQTAKIYFDVGIEYLQKKRIDEGIKNLRIAAEIDPTDHMIFYNLANAIDYKGDKEEAERLFLKAIELGPDYPDSHFNYAAMLAREGRVDEAAKLYERAYELDPGDDIKHLEWTTCLSLAGEPERAYEELVKLLDKRPDYIQARINLATLLAKFGRYDEAREQLLEVLAREPEASGQAMAHFHLGQLLEETGGDLREAFQHYLTAVEEVPDLIDAQAALARLLARDGAFTEAADRYALIVERRPDDFESRFALSLSLILAGRYAEARTALEEGLEADPEELPLRHLLARLLATCPEESVRNGGRALELANEVLERAESIDHAETVAMALAELGRFEEAAEFQRQILSHAQSVAPGQVAPIRERLSLYERGEPCRAPWRSS